MNKCLIVLLAILLIACKPEDPNSPPALRKALFKQMLHESEALSGMLRGRLKFDAAKFSGGAAKLAELSQAPWQYFEQPDKQEKSSNAQASLWQRQARFNQLARELETATDDLQQQAAKQSVSKEALNAPMQRVEQACKACHQEFRRF